MIMRYDGTASVEQPEKGNEKTRSHQRSKEEERQGEMLTVVKAHDTVGSLACLELIIKRVLHRIGRIQHGILCLLGDAVHLSDASSQRLVHCLSCQEHIGDSRHDLGQEGVSSPVIGLVCLLTSLDAVLSVADVGVAEEDLLKGFEALRHGVPLV